MDQTEDGAEPLGENVIAGTERIWTADFQLISTRLSVTLPEPKPLASPPGTVEWRFPNGSVRLYTDGSINALVDFSEVDEDGLRAAAAVFLAASDRAERTRKAATHEPSGLDEFHPDTTTWTDPKETK
ncbi:hypothetical protein [Mycobacteroides abscessus]|uniref:hypothetical protein n=1 Tax=Mycobacteroides abscessus TaxID=36809 RepID=UPI0005E94CF4|nr:hypothetical protein [Mycobacteroides abscessus]CPR79448.1 Uncharacterised protein [Mycobacteroides abscessus]CPR88569.1 Uncharacterised protein [Mycobacteroides abscessus]CPS43503.1 Uncharacterised protein [Mycobacteroides abscessus]CPV03294.1 Uncharacterised protein [Mycobacteroides abscessus]